MLSSQSCVEQWGILEWHYGVVLAIDKEDRRTIDRDVLFEGQQFSQFPVVLFVVAQ